MSRPAWTEEKIRRYVKEGRGQGLGPDYKPWLRATELSSKGVCTRYACQTVERTVHCLSNVELSFATLLDWDEQVQDIREQFPLPRELTRLIAEQLGIKHPSYPGTTVDTVMTVDFLVTRQLDGELLLEAYDVKCESDLSDPRVVEKLEITRAAFESKGVAHRLVLDTLLPKVAVANAAWILSGNVVPGEQEPVQGFFDDYCQRMSWDICDASGQLRLNEYCSSFDERFSLPPGASLRLARILMARRVLRADISQPKLWEAKLDQFDVIAPASQGALAVGGQR